MLILKEFRNSSIKASGLSTNAWASESGLSSTMTISISPPSS